MPNWKRKGVMGLCFIHFVYSGAVPDAIQSFNSEFEWKELQLQLFLSCFVLTRTLSDSLLSILLLACWGLPRENPTGSSWGSTVEHAIFKNWQQNSRGNGAGDTTAKRWCVGSQLLEASMLTKKTCPSLNLQKTKNKSRENKRKLEGMTEISKLRSILIGKTQCFACYSWAGLNKKVQSYPLQWPPPGPGLSGL